MNMNLWYFFDLFSFPIAFTFKNEYKLKSKTTLAFSLIAISFVAWLGVLSS